jgi:multidrug efflux pump subunit AcrA (membrane-fusion protein)
MCGCNKNTAAVKDSHAHNETGHAGEDAHSEEQKVCIDETTRKVMGLELKKAEYITMEDFLEVTGEIAKDTEKIFHVTPKTSGEITKIETAYGDIIKEGDVLAVIKTPDETEKIVSPAGGMITGVTVKQGQHVDEVTSLFTVSDFSVINANFDIYEKDMGHVRMGQRIKVKSLAYPDKTFTGKIVFISPRVDELSRTIKVRAEIDNSKYFLKFSMYVTGKLIVKSGDYLAVPSKAIQKVKDKQIVFVLTKNNEFIAKEIVTGFETNGYTQVLDGLNREDKIATEGSFLLKSELLKSEMGDGCAE